MLILACGAGGGCFDIAVVGEGVEGVEGVEGGRKSKGRFDSAKIRFGCAGNGSY